MFVKDEQGNLRSTTRASTSRRCRSSSSAPASPGPYYSASPHQSGYFWNALNGVDGVFHTDLWREETIRPSTGSSGHQGRRAALGDLGDATVRALGPPSPESCFTQNWVADIVNALIESDVWEQTAVFLTWDEWGGFYDHVPPPEVDDLGLGFRVPMSILSPYAKRGYVDDAVGEFSSPLKFIEDNWGLTYLTPTIEGTHNFEHVFDFDRNPRGDAQPIPKAEDLLRQPVPLSGRRVSGLARRHAGPTRGGSLRPRRPVRPQRGPRDFQTETEGGV